MNTPELGNEHIGIDAVGVVRSRSEAIYGSIVAKQEIDAGCHTTGGCFQMIAALLYQDQTSITQRVSQVNNNLTELGEARCGNVHIGRDQSRACIVLFPVSVKARGHQDELWIKAIRRRSHKLAKDRIVSFKAGFCGQGDINGCSQPWSLPSLIG